MKGPALLRRLHGRARHGTAGTDGHSAAPGEPALDLADIQGFVLRGYRMPLVRHFLLAVRTPAEARRQLGRLVSGDESDAPQITAADEWHVGFAPGPGDDPANPPRSRPDYCPNIGITWPGLLALELDERVPALSFKSFGAFIEGAAHRAASIGDTGASWPENWVGGFGGGRDHVLLTLHALTPEAMADCSDSLSAWFAEGDAFHELSCQDGIALMEVQNGQPGPTAGRSTSATRTGSVRPPFAVARSATTPITSGPASHGCSSWETTP